MIKSTSSTHTMTVKVIPLSGSQIDVELPASSTVAEALAKANVTTEGRELFVAGEPATSNDVLEDGDIIAVVTESPKGGRK